MKCLICNKELTGNVCERCGFPKISVVGGAEDDPVVKTAVHDYKENILKKITVEMETYQYKEDGNKLVLAQTDRIPIGKQLQNLDKDQCTWFQEDFARMEAGEPMTLTLFINNDGREVRREISLKAPDIRSFWKAGPMIGIFVTGYEDDTMKYIGHCYRGGILLTVIGFYITKLPVLAEPGKLQGQYIYYGLQFIIYVLLAAVLAMVPILVIAGIRHIILDIFDLITR